MPTKAGSGTYNQTDLNGCFVPKSLVRYFEEYGDPDFTDIPGTLATIRATSDSDWANVLTL